MTKELLNNQNNILQYLSDNSELTEWVYDIKKKCFTYISENIKDFIGYSSKEILENKIEWISGNGIKNSIEILENEVAKKSSKKKQSIKRLLLLNHKNGNEINASSIMAGVYNKTGNIIGITGILLQVVNLSDTNIAANLQNLHLSAPYAIVILNRDGRIININEKAAQMTGSPPEETIGKLYTDFIAKEHRNKAVKFKSQIDEYGDNTPIEFSLIRNDGDPIDAQLNATAIRDINGIIDAYVLIIKDITELNIAQNRLKRSEENTKALFNTATDAAYLLDYEGTILALNEFAMKRISIFFPQFKGKDSEAFVGLNITDYLGENEVKLFNKTRDKMIENNKPLRMEHSVFGRTFDISVSSIKNKKKKYYRFALYARDITEKKESEDRLKESEENFRALINASTDSAFLFDLDGNIIVLNDIAIKTLKVLKPTAKNYNKNKFIGTNFFDYISKELGREVRSYASQISKSKRIKQYELSYMNRIFNSSLFPVFDEDHNVTRIASFIRDVTEERIAQKELIDSESKYHQLIDNMFEGFIIIDKNKKITYVNNKIIARTGFSKEQMIGLNFLDLLDENNRKKCEDHFDILLAINETRFAINFFTRNKEEITIMISASVIKDEEGNFNGIQSMCVDITEINGIKKQLEYKADFQALIAFISTSFINLKITEIDTGIDSALASIGMFNDEDRIFLFQITDDGKNFTNTHEWCSEDTPSVKPERAFIAIDSIPYARDLLQDSNIVHIPNTKKLPKAASREIKASKKYNIKSFLLIPMKFRGILVGIIGVESIKKQKKWSKDAISLFHMMSNILANAIERKRINTNLIDVIMKRLSDREREFLQYLVKGYKWPSDKRLIGKKMDVLPGTLDKFMSRIREKIRSDEIDEILNTLRTQNFFEEISD